MKKIEILLLVAFLLIFVFSCGNGEIDKEALKDEIRKELESEQNQDLLNEEVLTENRIKSHRKKSDELSIGTFKKSMAQNLEYEGKIVHGEEWTDANGKNLAIFTSKLVEVAAHEGPAEQSVYLYAYHYADNGDGYKLLVKIQDWEEKCDLVNHAQIRLKTVKVTDLDNDGIAELTFIYRLGCNGDPTPIPMKLMMLENGEKYAIRGTTLVVLSPEYIYGGEMKVDPSFNNAPKEFLEFAKKLWETDKNYFDE